MITLRNLTKYYNVQGKYKLILDNLSLDIPGGKSVGLLGPNGAGKSTLLRIIAGIELPNSGSVSSTVSISWPVGLSSGFLPYLTGRENVQFLCRLHSNDRNEMRDKIAYVEEFCELNDYFDMPISTYSSGMKSRLGFGASFAFDFAYYIIDEAMGTGDARFKKKCKEYINSRIKKSSVIMVSHNMPTLTEFCDYGIYLNHGKIEVYENIEEAIARYEQESN